MRGEILKTLMLWCIILNIYHPAEIKVRPHACWKFKTHTDHPLAATRSKKLGCLAIVQRNFRHTRTSWQSPPWNRKLVGHGDVLVLIYSDDCFTFRVFKIWAVQSVLLCSRATSGKRFCCTIKVSSKRLCTALTSLTTTRRWSTSLSCKELISEHRLSHM